WAVDVIDADPEARGKAKSVKVKVAAEVCPTLPDEVPGLPFRPIEFESMAVVTYIDDDGHRPRVAYPLLARGVKAPGASGPPASGGPRTSANDAALPATRHKTGRPAAPTPHRPLNPSRDCEISEEVPPVCLTTPPIC